MEAMPKVFLNNPVSRRLREVASVAALDGRERADYEASLNSYRDTYAVFMTATREGYADGYAEGEARGLAEGEARGDRNLAHSPKVVEI